VWSLGLVSLVVVVTIVFIGVGWRLLLRLAGWLGRSSKFFIAYVVLEIGNLLVNLFLINHYSPCDGYNIKNNAPIVRPDL
jgi:hypothetical protein